MSIFKFAQISVLVANFIIPKAMILETVSYMCQKEVVNCSTVKSLSNNVKKETKLFKRAKSEEQRCRIQMQIGSVR